MISGMIISNSESLATLKQIQFHGTFFSSLKSYNICPLTPVTAKGTAIEMITPVTVLAYV